MNAHARAERAALRLFAQQPLSERTPRRWRALSAHVRDSSHDVRTARAYERLQLLASYMEALIEA